MNKVKRYKWHSKRYSYRLKRIQQTSASLRSNLIFDYFITFRRTAPDNFNQIHSAF